MLKELLQSRNITIVKAAKMLGIERETLHRKIAGKQPFYLKEAVVLYKMYFSDLDFFEIFSEYLKGQGTETPSSARKGLDTKL